jgi:hypothetical protein
MTDPALLELRLLREAVAALVDEQRHLTRRLLERDDRRAGLVLFPLISALAGSSPFTAGGLLQAALNDRSSVGQAVRELIVEASAGTAGLRAFGRLLARLEGCTLAGFKLTAAGEAREGLRWRLVRVSDE